MENRSGTLMPDKSGKILLNKLKRKIFGPKEKSIDIIPAKAIEDNKGFIIIFLFLNIKDNPIKNKRVKITPGEIPVSETRNGKNFCQKKE
jgi:hypothetical protein